MAVLRDLHGKREFPLRTKVTQIGRDPSCDVVISVPTVSAHHAIIVNLRGGYHIEDLDSLNGTFVNGQRVSQRTHLTSGDRIETLGLSVVFQGDEPLVSSTPDKPKASPAPGEAGWSGTGSTVPPGTIRLADLIKEDPEAAKVISSLEINGELRLAVKPEAKLRAVLEISRTLSNSLELKTVLPQILESLFSIFPQADCGFILLRDRNTGELVPRAVKHRDESKDELLPISRGILQQAVLTGCGILSADASRDERFDPHASIRRLDIRSILCVPMNRQGGECLGVIQLSTHDKTNQFQQEDLDLLVCCCLLAARAVELARLHEEWRELDAATQIQKSFLPMEHPACEGLHFFDHYSPAQHVGGDYYDYIPLAGNRLAVTMGDVEGKGISAALLMARLSAAARICLSSAPSLPEAVQNLNAVLTRSGAEDRFVTFVAIVFDLDHFQMTIVNAGHSPPILRRAAQPTVEEVGESIVGLPLGVMAKPYEQLKVAFEPGDSLVLYTDGVTEMRNPTGEMYGIERTRAAVQAGPSDVESLGTALLSDVRRFASRGPQGDDLTIVCVGRPR